MKKKQFIFMIIVILSFLSISFSGCSSNNTQPNQNQLDQSHQLELEKTRVTAAAYIAEEKLTAIFDSFTPTGSNQSYMVAKSYYPTIEDVKKFLNSYYTEKMTNDLVTNYIKLEDVPTRGTVPTLNLPDNYSSITGYTLTVDDKITINNDNATLSFKKGDSQITYSFAKVNSKWLVDGKTVK